MYSRQGFSLSGWNLISWFLHCYCVVSNGFLFHTKPFRDPPQTWFSVYKCCIFWKYIFLVACLMMRWSLYCHRLIIILPYCETIIQLYTWFFGFFDQFEYTFSWSRWYCFHDHLWFGVDNVQLFNPQKKNHEDNFFCWILLKKQFEH